MFFEQLEERVVLAASFTVAPTFGIGSGNQPVSVAAGDFNGDGKADLATANFASTNVSVLLGDGLGGFGGAANFTVGNSPKAVTVGDFDGDGKPDLAVANYGSSTVSVLLNRTTPGAPAVSFAAAINVNVGDRPVSLAVGDFDGDGKTDLVTAGAGVSSMLINTSTIGAPTSFSRYDLNSNFVAWGPGYGNFSVAVGDLNSDGKPDLAFASTYYLRVFLNTTPTGASPTFTSELGLWNDNNYYRASFISVGDFNGDGKLDLAATSSDLGSDKLFVRLNTTPAGALTASFGSLASFTVARGSGRTIAVGDFNGDGKADLAVSSPNVSVLLNTTTTGATTPSFAPAANIPGNTTVLGVGLMPRSVKVGDFDGDGKPDLVTANYKSRNVSVLLNNGNGVFAAAANFHAGPSPNSVALGDFDADGKLDLVVAISGTGSVSVLLNTTVPANSPPVVAANVAAVSANEGGTVSNAGTFSDAQGNNTVTLTATVGGVAFGTVTKNDSDGTWSWSANAADGPAGPFTVTIKATDTQIAMANATFTYAVNNVVPTISLSGNATVNEGSPYTLNLGVVTDPGQDTITGYKIDWGDGVIDLFGTLANPANPAASPAYTTATHTFAEGPATQRNNVTVTDDDGTILAAYLDVTVKNVAPTARLQENSGVIYGNAATASFGDIFDPSTIDTAAGLRYAFSLDIDTTGTVIYDTADTVASADFGVQNAGTHRVYARIFDKDGGVTPYWTTLEVNQAHVSVAADARTKVYDNNDATDPALTYIGGTLITGNSFSGSLTRDAGQTVAGGPYAITLGSLSAGSNYIIDYIGADFTVTKASSTTTVSIVGGPFTYTGSAQTPATVAVTGAGGLNLTPDASYANNTNAGTAPASYNYPGDHNHFGSDDIENFTIGQKSATVTADHKTKTYGDANPTLTATVAGTVNGDVLDYTLATTAVQFSNVGDYGITVTLGANGNYSVTPTNDTLSIARANQTITWFNPAAINYGTPLSGTQLNATVAGVSGGSDPGALTYSPSAGTVLLAGTQTLIVSAAATTNYNSATTSVSLVVNPYVSSGFLSPISINRAFKLGSSVPIKWQLSDASGNAVTSLAAITTLMVTGPGGTTLLYPGNSSSSGATVLRHDGSQFIYNWQTKGFVVGNYTITALLADGGSVTQTIMLSTSGGAAALVINGVTGTTAVGALLAGDLTLYVDNSSGGFSSDELARIDAAIAGIQLLVSPYGANIFVVDGSVGSNANIVLASGTTSVLGGMAEGILGVSTSDGGITIIDGWNWYAGNDAGAIGAGQFDFQTVITHEVAHSIGLGHNDTASSVMFPALATRDIRRALVFADLNTDGEQGGSGLHAEAIFAVGYSPEVVTAELDSRPLNSARNFSTSRSTGFAATPLWSIVKELTTDKSQNAATPDVTNSRDLNTGLRRAAKKSAWRSAIGSTEVETLAESQGIDNFFATLADDDGEMLDNLMDSAFSELGNHQDF